MSTAPDRWTQSGNDMWVNQQEDPRQVETPGTDERGILLDYLRRYRLTLPMKCADLDAERLARRSVPPSTMSLLGLVRHLAEVERSWFRRVLAGEDAEKIWCTPASPDEDFDGATADEAVVDQAWQAWHDEVAFAEAYLARTDDLATERTTRRGETVSLRDILVHMIEEYARHCGHADLLRECIDGRVGQ